MKRKGIAIPYIIALILGIIVIALLGYWFFVLGFRFVGEMTLTDCQGSLQRFCQEYSASGYSASFAKPVFTRSDCGAASTASEFEPRCCGYYANLLSAASWRLTCAALLGQ